MSERECGQRQEGIEHDREYISHGRSSRKGLLEHVKGWGKDKRGAAIGLTPTEKAAGKIIKLAKIATKLSIMEIEQPTLTGWFAC